MSIEPINPSEVLEIKDTLLPNEVIIAFNFLIAKNFKNGLAEISHDDAVSEIIFNFKKNGKNIEYDEVLENNYLEVENLYRNKGWKVRFEKDELHNKDKFFIFKK